MAVPLTIRNTPPKAGLHKPHRLPMPTGKLRSNASVRSSSGKRKSHNPIPRSFCEKFPALTNSKPENLRTWALCFGKPSFTTVTTPAKSP